MSRYRLHSQLASAIRAAAKVRAELNENRRSPIRRLACQMRGVVYTIQVRYLLDEIHNQQRR